MCTLILEKVDSGPDQQKYVFQVGEHIVGRGPELKCTSKKVSRKHATIKVTPKDGVFLESTHNNPVYYLAKSTGNIDLVTFSNTIKLDNEDKISLASDHGWFTVKITKTNEEELPSGSISNKRAIDKDEPSEAKKIKLNDDNTTENNTELHVKNTTELQVDTNDNTTELHTDTNETTEVQVPEIPERNETIQQEVPEIKEEPLDESTNQPEIEQELEVEVKEEPEDDPKNANKQTDPSAASTSVGNGSSRRERCWYGSSCYRKNPQHRATFSHPNDTDYDSDPNDTRAVCCYGVNCYRRNKLHREKYRHPGQDKIADPPSKNNKSKGGNHFHVHFRNHQQPAPHVFVRRVRMPYSNNHRYIVIDFDVLHPYDNLLLDEDLDIFDAPSDPSDSDYFSGPDD